MEIAFPFEITAHGSVAEADYNDHVYQMIEQVLFTDLGERVNRPTFGCSIAHLIFAPMASELVTATQALVHTALQQFLGDVIKVEAVQTTAADSTLTLTIQYVILRTQTRQVATFSR
jgi:phage baseplate assembly protein W